MGGRLVSCRKSKFLNSRIKTTRESLRHAKLGRASATACWESLRRQVVRASAALSTQQGQCR